MIGTDSHNRGGANLAGFWPRFLKNAQKSLQSNNSGDAHVKGLVNKQCKKGFIVVAFVTYSRKRIMYGWFRGERKTMG